ncbi:MAG: zinc metalloprotease HtpX [Leptolyngbyaceae cyanobacterium bins.302]|nr:zinc metalloprotease HtpX [Leptolyngbyaceae cyanobacterium bins.302]
MTTIPESSLFDSQSGRASDFEAGLAAFKEAEYATAIVLLEPALAESPNHPLIARAQMGLAIAYEKMGETERAFQLCQSLQQQGSAQVQEWATRTLVSLLQRHPELGLQQEVVESPASLPSQVSEPHLVSESTGFTPLDEAELPPATEQNWAESSWAETDHSEASAMPPADTIASPPSFTPLNNSPIPPLGRSSQSLQDDRSQHPEATLSPPSLYQPIWRQAGRAESGKSLGKVNLLRLGVTRIITAIACYLAVQQVFFWVAASYGNAVIKILPRLGFRVVQPGAPTWTEAFALVALLILFVGSRWILDAILTLLHGLKPFSINELSVYSPEAAASLPRFCRKSGIPVPALGILPTQTPIAFSYGIVPHVSRVVVSQGLLEQLADDEIAAIYANEVGHLSYWTVPLLSGITTLLQLPYILYWVTAEWGNQKDSPITKACATLISVISYGFFWLWRWVPLWLSRQRTYYSDRVATELTGNPNGYTRALMKLAIGTAKDVQQQGQTSYLLEGFEILAPLGHRIATPLGSLYPHAPLENVLEWERSHPLRHWFALNNTHPPTGERLNLLALYARHWQLDTELNWQDPTAPRRAKKPKLTGQQWRSLLLQGSPYFGFAFGLAIALLLRVIGWVGYRANWDLVSWMARDRTILFGLPLVGLCIGILLRLNPFFPDLPHQAKKLGNSESLPPLFQQPDLIPLTSQPLQLEGTLLGRRGISNLLNQDLWLNTATGMVKLHCTSRLGVLSSFLPQANRPANLVNSPLVATGWFRRSTSSWVDVETLRTAGGRIHRSDHPVWGFLIAAIAATCGILAIFNF